MKKVWQILSYILVAAVSAAAAFCLAEKPAEVSKLEQLESLIQERFIGEADLTAMEDAAAEAMVAAIGDRWSHYMTAEEYQSYLEQVKNAYVGIGITITVCEDGFDVVKVNEGGPAQQAGMAAGDVIIAIEGQTAAGMSTSDAGKLVKGMAGTVVHLTVRRGGESLELEVTRQQVQVPVATAQLLEGQVGLITIANFDERCAEESIAAIESLLAQGAQSLIFDVRNNPGGYKDELVDLLNYLLPEGPLFRSVNYQGKIEVDESDAACLEIPMAVLVNGDSYSAAEFFAAALREYEAAVLVGQPTTGKGHFQHTWELTDGSALTLSVGKYTTPNDVNLDGVGLTPDITVDVDEEMDFAIYAGTISPAEDPQIQAAVQYLTK